MSYRGRSVFFVIIERFVDSLRPKNLRPNVRHIGRDYLGNNYFETEKQRNRKTLESDVKNQCKRWFKPPDEDLWDRPLPPEWNAWLRRMRADPPTDEEIERNRLTEERMKAFDKTLKGIQIESKPNPYSSFPSHPDYEDIDRSSESKYKT